MEGVVARLTHKSSGQPHQPYVSQNKQQVSQNVNIENTPIKVSQKVIQNMKGVTAWLTNPQAGGHTTHI